MTQPIVFPPYFWHRIQPSVAEGEGLAQRSFKTDPCVSHTLVLASHTTQCGPPFKMALYLLCFFQNKRPRCEVPPSLASSVLSTASMLAVLLLFAVHRPPTRQRYQKVLLRCLTHHRAPRGTGPMPLIANGRFIVGTNTSADIGTLFGAPLFDREDRIPPSLVVVRH